MNNNIIIYIKASPRYHPEFLLKCKKFCDKNNCSPMNLVTDGESLRKHNDLRRLHGLFLSYHDTTIISSTEFKHNKKMLRLMRHKNINLVTI